MKMMTKITLALLAMICLIATAQAKSWYEGGTLHKATVGQFLASDYDNERATAADWVVSTVGDNELKKVGELNLKHGVEAVVDCIEKATKGVAAVQNNAVNEIAVMCMAQLKKDYPWMMTKY